MSEEIICQTKIIYQLTHTNYISINPYITLKHPLTEQEHRAKDNHHHRMAGNSRF